ncbi:MAG: Minf_1886 family protein, partial [Chthoniobacteraceae bacterium]
SCVRGVPIMESQKFDHALDRIISRDPRFDRAAYHFLRDALNYTLKQRKKATGQAGHLTGQHLLEGLRQHALKQFGPMVTAVFSYWGVRTTEDFGVMVFHLVEEEIFGKTDDDAVEDFRDVYDFHDVFVAPFLPAPREDESPRPARLTSVEAPAPKVH